MILLVAFALALVLLHGPAGHQIYVNPESVTTMTEALPGSKNKHIVDTAKCLLNTTDGKFISVVETCDEVRALFQQGEKPKP
jgi:hypothetical protein